MCIYLSIYIYRERCVYIYIYRKREMCVYIYICIYIYISNNDNNNKRGLECGVRAPVFCGNPREQTGENGFPQIPAGSLFCSYRNLRKSPEASGSYPGERNLGILYSSSLSGGKSEPPRRSKPPPSACEAVP